MVEGILIFEICLDYELTGYKNLANRAISHTYDSSQKKYIWRFYVKDLDFVISTIAKPITFKNSEMGIKQIISLCPPVFKRVPSSMWKGEGEYDFIEQPTVFLCGEWQKDSEGAPKQRWTKVPKQNATDIWELLLRYPKKKFVKGRTIAENLCREKGYGRFYDEKRKEWVTVFRDSGTFEWEKFWGLHRKGYMPLCYWPFKILDFMGAAKFDKKGRICRLKDKLEFQTQFKISDF